MRLSVRLSVSLLYPHSRGAVGIARSVRLYVSWSSCVGYRHAGCLQLIRRRPPEMCGLRTRPWTDVDPLRFLDRTAIGVGGGHIVSPPPGGYLVCSVFFPNVCAASRDIRHTLKVSRYMAAAAIVLRCEPRNKDRYRRVPYHFVVRVVQSAQCVCVCFRGVSRDNFRTK